jgi:D-alanine--poly(phosphoribitol) ligase subunit 2
VPSADTDLLETGILDSFQFVELLFQLEQSFGLRISVDDIDLEDLRTLARIARLVAANGGGTEPSVAQRYPGAAG